MPETQTLPTWDLSDLYSGIDDPKLKTDLEKALELAEAFASKYRDQIATAGLTAATLREALEAYEALALQQSSAGAFASLHFSTDTTDPARGALLQYVREACSEISTHLIFFDLEIGRIPDETYAAVSASPELAAYRHHLDYERSLAKHHLSEEQETVLEETANCGGRAFQRLFTEVSSRLKYRFERDGEVRQINQSELLAYSYDPDRALRKQASESLAAELEKNSHVLTFTHNTLLHEKEVMDRLRGFDSPEAERHLANELPSAVVDTMVEVCVANFSIVEDYYALKGKLLGISPLTHYDRYAPLLSTKQTIAYDQAKAIVLQAFARFSPRLEDTVKPFFENPWIDAPPKDGKRSGAFCAGVTPKHHPYVLLNYTDKPRDVMTLAHELGHACHDVLASKNHLFDYHPVLPLAETASTFAELLVFDKLLEDLDSDHPRLALICEKLEDTFATVFRQISMYRFEQKLHRLRREEGELQVETINDLWQSCMQEMFGKSLELGPEHRWTWLYIPHIVQTPFYVYAYAFGELLVLSLYARYRQEGAPFIDKYFKLLAAGGSKAPLEILQELGIDATQRDFWQGGCQLIRQNLEKAQKLAVVFSQRTSQ